MFHPVLLVTQYTLSVSIEIIIDWTCVIKYGLRLYVLLWVHCTKTVEIGL